MTELLSFGGLVALTIGVTEIGKRAGIPTRFAPIVALVVGFVLALIGNLTSITGLAILTGIAVGLAASGLFDVAKISVLGKK